VNVIALFKSIPLAALLTLVVALFLGSGGMSGGTLAIIGFTVEGTRIYWSWVLFCSGTALIWALLLMIGD
jgi:hypothetical protein